MSNKTSFYTMHLLLNNVPSPEFLLALTNILLSLSLMKDPKTKLQGVQPGENLDVI